MKKYIIPKLVGLAFLSMVTLVIVSILEVVIYSYLIDPGHEAAYYDAHADVSAPYISCIVGFILMFFIARYWRKRNFDNALKLSILLPFIYILMDVMIITAAGVSWSDFIMIFAIANAAKFLGSILGFALTKPAKI